MKIEFDNETAAVLSSLERKGYSKKTLAEHRRCYDELRKYLLSVGKAFSMDIALNWLEARKDGWSFDTYKRYRRALYRFKKYLESHSIEHDLHCRANFFAYLDADVSYIRLPDNYRVLFHEFHTMLSAIRSKGTVEHYIVPCTDFLLFISERGCDNPTKLAIEYLPEYIQRILETSLSLNTKKKYMSGIAKLLTFLSERGYIPRCYSFLMSVSGVEEFLAILKLAPASGSNGAFHPSKELDAYVIEFLARLEEHRYRDSPRKLFNYIFMNFFLYLEINHLEYSFDIVKIWLENFPKDTSWSLKRRIMKWFDEYLNTGDTDNGVNTTWRPLLVDSLPDWSRLIISDYLLLRKKEGCTNSTLITCRASCVKFFRFLNSKGVVHASAITPALVKEFSTTDVHTTTEGKNAYSMRIRRFLIYMAENNLVPQNLYLAVSTHYAPRRTIISVMSPEMEAAVYRYREDATSPCELRDAAIIMIGLRMGLRASDVVNLRLESIDWKESKVTIIQAKTGKSLSLPMPTEVGNSLYQYLTKGRAQPGKNGLGYVFISHEAPYSKLSKSVCRGTLRCVLSEYGIDLPNGQGFHITRRTFATKLLTSKTTVDTIVDSLGHTTRQSISAYLSMDENGMRLCPLSFMIGGQQ